MSDHVCAISVCDAVIPREWCLCATHFAVAPRSLREDLARAYNRYALEQSSSFHVKRARLETWLRADAEVRERPRVSWDQVVSTVRDRDATRAARRALEPSRELARDGAEKVAPADAEVIE